MCNKVGKECNLTGAYYLFGKLVFLAEWFNSPLMGPWHHPYNLEISEGTGKVPRTAQNALYAMRCMVVVPLARDVTSCAVAQNRGIQCDALLWCILEWLIPMASGDNGQRERAFLCMMWTC